MKRFASTLLLILASLICVGQCAGGFTVIELFDQVGDQRGCYQPGETIIPLVYLNEDSLSKRYAIMRFAVMDTQGKGLRPFSWTTHNTSAQLDSMNGQYYVSMPANPLGPLISVLTNLKNAQVLGAGYATDSIYQGALVINAQGVSLVNKTDTTGCWYDTTVTWPACQPLPVDSLMDEPVVQDPVAYKLRGRQLEILTPGDWKLVTLSGQQVRAGQGPAWVQLCTQGIYVLQHEKGLAKLAAY